MTATTIAHLSHLATGRRSYQLFGDEPSAFAKITQSTPVFLGPQGLTDDEQANHRFHGGPDRALCFFAQSNYPVVARFLQTPSLNPVAFGENCCVEGIDEHGTMLGDIWQIGQAQVEVCQPRSPCWKLNSALDNNQLASFLSREARIGWLARTRQTGNMQAGDACLLLHRPAQTMSIAEFWQLWLEHRPPLEALARAIEITALPEQWRQRLEQKHTWLDQNTSAK